MRIAILITLIIPISLAATLTYHSTQNDIYSGIPVVFNVVSNSTHHSFDSGDGAGFTGFHATKSFTHIYKTSGDYIARVLGNDSIAVSRISVADCRHLCNAFCFSNITGNTFSMQVCDPQNNIDSDLLTKMYIELGEVPKIQLRGGSIAALKESSTFWNITVEVANDVMYVTSSGTVVSGCGVLGTHFVIGAIVQHPVYHGMAQTNVSYIQSPCSSGSGWMLIDGSIIVKTNDGGEHLVDLQVNQTRVTSIGLYRNDAIFANDYSLQRVFEGKITPLSSFLAPFKVYGGSSACPYGPDDTVVDTAFIAYSNGSELNEIAYSNDCKRAIWTRVELFETNRRVIGAIWCPDREQNVYLLTNTDGLGAHVANGFTFPTTVRLDGLHAHVAQVCAMIAYGDELWISVSGPQHFDVVLKTPDDPIVAVVSCTEGSYAATTNSGALYWGKLGTRHIVRVASNVRTAILDISGDLHVLLGSNLQHYRLPVQPYARSAREGIDSDVSLTLIRRGRLRFKGLSGVFTQQQVGFVIAGNWTIVSVDGGQADAVSSTCMGLPTTTAQTTQLDVKVIDSVVYMSVNDSWWTQSHIGQSIILDNAGTIHVKSIVNSTHAEGTVVFKTVSDGLYNWSIHDFRQYIDDNTADVSQVLTATPSSATLSTGTMEWTSRHVGALIYVGSTGWGLIIDLVSTTVVTVSWQTSPSFTQYSRDQWSIHWSEQGMQWTNRPHSKLVAPWSLKEPPCPYTEFDSSATVGATSQSSKTVYLDTDDELSVVATDSAAIYFSNPSVVDFNVSDNTVKVIGSQYGVTTAVAVRPRSSSLLCSGRSGEWKSKNLVIGCPYSKALKHAMNDGLTLQDYYKNPVFPDNTSRWEDIPVNYRPPSKLGVAIPTTSRFYNADQSKPKYRSVLKVSRDSGEFQGRPCGSGVSFQFSEAECLKRVPRVYYGAGTYRVQLHIHQGGQVSREPIKYTLKELNGRTDWCNSRDNVDCSNRTMVEAMPLYTSNTTDGIIWSGPELYHFRATAHSDSVCLLETDFAVWVFQPPNDETVVWSYSMITAVTMSFFLLVAFILFVRSNEGEEM